MRRTKKKRVSFFIFFIILSCFLFWGAVFLGYRVLDSKNSNHANTEHPTDEQKPRTEDSNEQTNTRLPEQRSLEQKLASTLEAMTLEEKIGQLLIVGFQTTEPDEHIETMIRDYHIGGVILFDRNMKNPTQVAELTKRLQQLASQKEQPIPLSFGVDQEGGQIIRMKEHVSFIPSQQHLGQTGDSEKVYNLAVRTGKELAAMGFTINFAPVLDLSSKDPRSFGSDPKLTSKYGNEVIKGLVAGGVTATIKHFPGNGRSAIDPHKETSSVQADQLDLENSDIYPFKKAIQEITNDYFFVMVTHIKYPAYDKVNPASISPTIIKDLLREKLGYTGLVVTDDLEMGAVNKYFTYEALGVKAVESGADLLLVCHTFENQKKVFNGIFQAVKSGQLSEDQINEAVKRVLAYKFRTLNIETDIVGK